MLLVQKSIDQFVVAMIKLTLILVLLPPSEFLNLLTASVNKKGLEKLDLLIEILLINNVI
mgnify:CR=1 FL=1